MCAIPVPWYTSTLSLALSVANSRLIGPRQGLGRGLGTMRGPTDSYCARRLFQTRSASGDVDPDSYADALYVLGRHLPGLGGPIGLDELTEAQVRRVAGRLNRDLRREAAAIRRAAARGRRR